VILPPTTLSFAPVAGLPLLQRTVLSARRCGFDRIIVLGCQHVEEIRRLLAGDKRLAGVDVTDVVNCGDGFELALIASDYLVTSETFERVNAVHVDGVPLLFGNAGESGVAVCRSTTLANIDLAGLTAGGAEALWAALRERGARTVSLDGALCVRITDIGAVAAAESALCAHLRAASKDSDGPLAHWIDRRISLRMSRWLVRHTRLRPNQITFIGTGIGLLAALLLSIGNYWAGVAGTLLFLCATIIDGCDGEVARLKFQESSFGEKLDVATDNIVHVAIFIGLAVGLYHRDPQGPYLALMGILLGGFACDMVVSYFFLVRRPGFAESRGAPVSLKGRLRRWLLHGFEAVMNRDFAYLLVGFAIADRLSWFLWGTAFGTYLFALLLVCIYRWRDAR
jgi:phosphatidylglycerophosphate synthase